MERARKGTMSSRTWTSIVAAVAALAYLARSSRRDDGEGHRSFASSSANVTAIELDGPPTMSVSSSSRSLVAAAETVAYERPVMRTFFVRIDPDEHGIDGDKRTGMSDEADRRMLQHWKRYWAAAGWEPRVLTLDDAMRHPEYERFDELLDLEKTPFGYYDKLCILRWLAMATVEVGGGWMADYDTFPLRWVSFADGNDALPNDGELTVYDQTVHGGIPCLVSGTREEWDRMAHLVLENTLAHLDEPFWSDMFAVMDVHRADPSAFHRRQGVLRGEYALTPARDFAAVNACTKMAKHHWAVHFSHEAIKRAASKGHIGHKRVETRPLVAEGWLNQWSNKCKRLWSRPYDPVSPKGSGRPKRRRRRLRERDHGKEIDEGRINASTVPQSHKTD